jgi:hypothetical protein
MESRIIEPIELENGLDDDMTIVSRLGLDGLKSQLDKHSSYLAERIETGRQNGLSLVEVAAGALAVIGTVGSLATIKYAR